MAQHPPSTEQTTPPSGEDARRPNRFFDWMRSLGVPRAHGWVGGVAAGIGNRLGIDPVIVRGILVVIAVLGGPAVLLYGVAWALLPDERDEIHLQRLLRGRFDPAIAGIAVAIAIGVTPIWEGLWFMITFGTVPGWLQLGNAGWNLALIAVLAAVVVWIVTRSRRVTPPAPGARRGTEASNAATAPRAEPSDEELASWSEGQSEWREHRAAYQEQRAIPDAELAAAATREIARDRAAEAAALAAERRAARAEWRRRNPRLGLAVIAMVLGGALAAAAIAALIAAADRAARGFELPIALAAATLVLGVGIVAAGAWRRRSGLLSAIGAALLIATLATAAIPRGATLAWPGSYWSAGSGPTAQAFGTLHVNAWVDDSGPREIELWQGFGQISVQVPTGATVLIEGVVGSGELSADHLRTVMDPNGEVAYSELDLRPLDTASDGTFRHLLGPGTVPDVTIHVWQGAGVIQVWRDDVAAGLDAAPKLTPTPTPSLTPSPSPTPSPSATPTREPQP